MSSALSLGETNTFNTHALIGGVYELLSGVSNLNVRVLALETPNPILINPKTGLPYGSIPADFSHYHIDMTTGLPVLNTNPSSQMPADVAAAIRADAERRYPTDFDMQLFVIKKQTEAWHKLHP